MNVKMAGKVAIVTGAGGGVGIATARAMAAAGANVVCVDADAAAADRAAEAVRQTGTAAVPIVADVASEVGCAAMVRAAAEEWGRLDILHNNAALTDPETVTQDLAIADLAPDVFDRVIGVNLRGPYLGCRAAIPLMIESGGGVIINTSSIYSLAGDNALAAYSVSKGGLNALTRHVAAAYGRRGIRCNTLVLGVVNTPAIKLARDTKRVKGFVAATVTGRAVEPEEVAALATFLATDEAASITGQVIPIDGGQSAIVPWWQAEDNS